MKQALWCAAMLGALLLVPAPAGACSCTCKKLGDGGPRAMAKHSAAVFVGEAIQVIDPTETERKHEYYGIGVKFRVERYWKGVKTREIVVHTRYTCCQIMLNTGTKYLIYAAGSKLETGCTRTRQLDRADDDLKALGPGKAFDPVSTGQ